MINKSKEGNGGEAPANRPYAMLGSGKLCASVWKEGELQGGWRYHFNLFRMHRKSGRVIQRFTPADIVDLAKLTRLLAFTIADDGCLQRDLQDDLFSLSGCLDNVLGDPNR